MTPPVAAAAAAAIVMHCQGRPSPLSAAKQPPPQSRTNPTDLGSRVYAQSGHINRLIWRWRFFARECLLERFRQTGHRTCGQLKGLGERLGERCNLSDGIPGVAPAANAC